MDMLSMVCLVLYVVGILMAWNQLSNGTGVIGSRMSRSAFQKINKKAAKNILLKIGACLLLGFIMFGILCTKGVLWVLYLIFRQ